MADVEIAPWLKSLPLAPEFHPTEAEFADPIAYISKIEAEARNYGICKIVPPLPKVPKKTVIASLNRSLLQSLDATAAATRGTASNSGRSMSGSAERNQSEVGHSMADSMAAGLGRSMSGSSQMTNRGTLSTDVGVGGELKAKFNTRRQQVGWSARRSRGQLHSLAQKLVWQSGESYTIEQFEAKAKQFSRTRLRTSKELSPLVIETLFWKATADKPITVEYGNDIPGSAFGEPLQSDMVLCPTSRSGKKRKRGYFRSGEPCSQTAESEPVRPLVDCKEPELDIHESLGPNEKSDNVSQHQRIEGVETFLNDVTAKGILRAKSDPISLNIETERVGLRKKVTTGDARVEKGGPGWKVANSPWNMRIIARSPGSPLRYMPDEVPGVTSPMVYIGMLFSWFAWHVEDHELHSLNYLHTGAPKTWYAVPGEVAPALEEVVRVFGYGNHLDPQAAFALLGEKTTVMSPEVLIAAGVPCCRLVQNPGEFVVTFPRAYHLGFSHGFNCGEAANFATPAWLEVAKEAATRRAAMNYLPMLSHQQLLYLLALSLPARIPSALPSEPRSSRLKDKKRSLGEETVKTVFAKDVALNNRQLGLLLDAGVSSCLLLGDDVGLSPVQLGHIEQVKFVGASVPPEGGISASSPCTADVTAIVQQESACTILLDQPNSISSSLWRRQQEDTISAINSNSILLAGAENHQDSRYESLVSALSLEWGTLPCAACGVLCFSSMAIIQPDWKGAASSIPTCRGNDNLEVHLSSTAAGKHENYASDFVSDPLHNSTCFSRSSLSCMEFKPESVSGKDREVGGIQMSENPHDWDNCSRDDVPVLQKMMGTKQVSEHRVQINDISSPEKVITKLCSDNPGHKNCVENSPHCTASAEDQVSEHRVQNNDISFLGEVIGKLCSDNPGHNNCVDNFPHCTASAEDSEVSSEQHISDTMAASQKHHVEGPECLANGNQGEGEGLCTSTNFREGDETKNAMNKEGFEHAVDKVSIPEKDESESTVHVTLVNRSLSVLELLAATYQDSSDSEDDIGATSLEETEDFGAHFCPNSAFSSFSADEVGCTVDAPWHCSMSKDEWAQEGLLSSNNVHELIINDPSVTMHSNEMKKLFVCKEVLLQQYDGKYELREYMPKVEACHCVKGMPECESQSKSMECNAIDTDKCDLITILSSGVNEGRMVPPQIDFQNITQSTSDMLLMSSTGTNVEIVGPGLHLTPTASEVSKALPSKALGFQISKCMATNDPEGKSLIVTEITQVPDDSSEERKELVKSGIMEHIHTCRNDSSVYTTRNDEEGHCWDLALEYSADTDDRSKQDDLNRMVDLIEAGANNQGKERHPKANLNAFMTEQSFIVCDAKSTMEIEIIQHERSEDKADGLSMPAAENPCIAESKKVEVGADFSLFHEQAQKPNSLPSRGVARPRFLCLEHALEAHHHLKSLGGVYMVIICHSGLVNIEQRAKGLAEELGLDHHWRSIPFRKANQEEKNFINLALDIEDEGEYNFQDWVVQLGMSICHNLKRRERFWADHSHKWCRESFGSSMESYPYPMNNSVVLSYEAQIQPSLNVSVLKSDSEGRDASKASKQKKISVAGRWCGRVWMNNQVHPVLGGCHNAQVPLQPIFPLLSPLQVLAAGTIDNTKPRGRPRKHAVQHGEEFCLEGNMKGCSLEADIGMSFKGEECSVQPLKKVEEGAGETERGICSVQLQPDTQSRFLLEGIGKKRKVGERNTIVDPAHAMQGMENWKKRREIEPDTVDSSVLNNSCLVSGLQGPSYSCHLSSTYFYQGLGDEIKSISCMNALTGNYMSSFDIPDVELGKNCVPGEIMINSALSDAHTGQDVAVARDSSISTVLQEIMAVEGTVRGTDTPILLPREPCFSEEVICKTGTKNNSCLHGSFRRRACSVFDGHRQCLGKTPTNQSHGLEPECAESKFTEYTPYIAMPEMLESGAAEGSECARNMKRKQEDQYGTSHFSSFPVEGPSTRSRTRSATKLKKFDDEEVANDGADNMTARNVKKAFKQSQKKTKKTRVKDVEDESGSCPCDIEGCNMRFSSKQELNMHKRNTCTFTGCGKRFGSHKYLLQHRRVHIDDRPLKCLYKGCKMTFKWPWARTEHLRVHTGERPYKCPVPGCGLTFRFVSDFSRHKRKTGHTKQ